VKRRDGARAHAGASPPRPKAPSAPASGPETSWPDSRLVRDCLRGREEAWSALLDKYKNLIFSIPIRRGLSREDAADVFQRVCVLLLAELPQLREARALPMWIIRVTSHECERWRRQERSQGGPPAGGEETPDLRDGRPLAEEELARLGQEQILREAIRALPPRCRDLIEMLFFETPVRPYQEAARALGLAPGSIGFIRGRCLSRLRRQLETMGFR